MTGFEKAHNLMVLSDTKHIEVSEQDGDDSIENVDTGPSVWLVAGAASISGSLFGYDTGIISAVLVYLETDLNHHTTSANER